MAAPMESRNPEGKSLEESLANMDLNTTDQAGDHVQDDTLLPLEPLYKLCMKYYKGLSNSINDDDDDTFFFASTHTTLHTTLHT